jgi:hypothetical protein
MNDCAPGGRGNGYSRNRTRRKPGSSLTPGVLTGGEDDERTVWDPQREHRKHPRPPLRAGPVRVEGPRPAPPSDSCDEEDVRLALLAGLALRYLARDRGRAW